MRAESFRDIVLVPSEDTDWLADRDKVKPELHLATKPDVIADDPVFTGIGATFPNLTTEQELAGLDGHVPIGIDRSRNGDLVEEVKKVQMLIEHDGWAEDGISSGSLKFLKSVG